MGVAQPSASPTDLKIGTKSYRVGPLRYKERGTLEHQYFPVAKSPLQRVQEALDSINTEDVRQHFEHSLKNARILSVGWEPHIEDDQAKILFTTNYGKAADDDTDYVAYFVYVCLSRYPNNEIKTPEEAWLIAQEMTKSQLDWLWNFCLEVGPFRPKSSEDDG